MNEDETVRRFIEHHVGRGATLLGSATGNRSGIDALLRLPDGLSLAAEGKGMRQHWGSSQKTFDDGFARLPQIAAGLKAQRMDGNLIRNNFQPNMVALVLPATDHFRRHSAAFLPVFEAMGYGLYWVDEATVQTGVAPRAM